jgi:flagellar hook assembly protein FlgD
MMRLSMVKALSIVVTLAAGVMTTCPAPTAEAADGDLLRLLYDQSDLTFSPNGDGVQDRARVVFRVKKQVRAFVFIRGDGKSVLRRNLGELEPGIHVVRWAGRASDGTRVRDGSYAVSVVAHRGVVQQRMVQSVQVDTVNSGELVTTRRTVYPKADVVDDRVEITWVQDGWSPYEAEYGDVFTARAAIRITDHGNRPVYHDVVKNQATPSFTWDGTDGDGHVLAAGRYRAEVTAVDPAGNAVHRATTLRVSSKQLDEQIWSATLHAADVPTYEPYYGGCNGCGDVCSPVPSTRFAGGLSYGPCSLPYTYATIGYYGVSVPVLPSPVDSFRIGVTGGPTKAGAADTGLLYVSGPTTLTVSGEGTTTSDWFPVALHDYPYLPHLAFPVQWAFYTQPPASYDVATFTVEYRYYVPVVS